MGTATEKAGEIWVAVRERLCSVPLCSFVGVEMYLQETRMNGKPIQEERVMHRETRRNLYLEERLVSRRWRWNLDRVEFLLEFGTMIVNVRYLDDDSRSWWQRWLAVVSHCHLKSSITIIIHQWNNLIYYRTYMLHWNREAIKEIWYKTNNKFYCRVYFTELH